MSFDEFQSKWTGQRVDYDHVYQYQCVDLILEYIYEGYQINGAYGNAIDFWTNPDPKLMAKFYKVGSSDAQKGDIVIFYGLSGNPYGHIGIATGNININDIEILEQNGATGSGSGLGGDAIRTRYVTRSRVAGLLRPASTNPLPPTYVVEDIVTKTIELNKDTPLWDMNQPTFDAMVANPGQTYSKGYQETTAALAHHSSGESYYMVGNDSTTGFNVKDCDNYTPPKPVEQLPTAPVTAPSSEQYEVIKTIPGYMTSNRAANHIGPDSQIEAGSYFVFNRVNEMINVTKAQGQPNAWINPSDNVVDPPLPTPTPEPSKWNNPRSADPVLPVASPVPTINPNAWKATKVWLKPDHSPVLYRSKNEKVEYILDLDRGQPSIKLLPKQWLHMTATFKKDGKVYFLATKVDKQGLWYGIEDKLLESEDSIMDYQKTLAERVVTKSTKLSDYPALLWAYIRKLFKRK